MSAPSLVLWALGALPVAAGTGGLTREVRFEGGLVAPTVVTTLAGEAVELPGLPAPARGRLVVRYPVGARVMTFEAWAESEALGRVTARGTVTLAPWNPVDDAPRLDPGGPSTLELEARGFDPSLLAAFWPALPLSGRGDLRVSLAGRAEAPQGQVVLEAPAGALSFRGMALDATRVELGLAGGRATLAVQLGEAAAPYLTLRADGPLGLDPWGRTAAWQTGEPHAFTLVGRGLTPARLRPFWRAPAAADFSVDVDARSEGHLDRFFTDAVVTGTLRDGGRPPLRVTATARMEPRRQAVTVRLGRDALEATVEMRAPLPDVLRGSAALSATPLVGRVVAAVPLETLAPYLPIRLADPVGRLNATLTLAGSLGTPDLRGQMVLDGAAVTLPDLLLRLSDIETTVAFAGREAHAPVFRARAGREGVVAGSGRLRFDPTPDPAPGSAHVFADWTLAGAAALSVRDVPFVQPELPFGRLSGSLVNEMRIQPSGTDLTFTIRDTRLVQSRERLPPARAVPRNAAVRNRDWLARVIPAESLLSGPGRLRLTIDLATPILVDGEDTALRLTGRLALHRDGPVVEVDGGFDVVDGRFVLFENPFALRSGRFTLQGGHLEAPEAPTSAGTDAAPLEPVVSLLANGYIVDTDVTVGVEGPARQPRLVLRSNPPLAEYQILTLLVSGRANALDDSNGDVRREAAQLVDRFHNPSLERQLYDRLGVDKLGLAFGDAVDQPILTVGRQINRELYVETKYHHNAPPTENERELRVEYQLTRRFSVDTAYGDAAVGSVGLAWRGRFGGQPPAKPRSSLVEPLSAPAPEPSDAPDVGEKRPDGP